MDNAPFILTAFAVVWAVVFGYVFLLFNKQRRLLQEIDSLKEASKGKGVEQ